MGVQRHTITDPPQSTLRELLKKVFRSHAFPFIFCYGRYGLQTWPYLSVKESQCVLKERSGSGTALSNGKKCALHITINIPIHGVQRHTNTDPPHYENYFKKCFGAMPCRLFFVTVGTGCRPGHILVTKKASENFC
jgi:hypothetical protein